jgi:hypothetical protein
MISHENHAKMMMGADAPIHILKLKREEREGPL